MKKKVFVCAAALLLTASICGCDMQRISQTLPGTTDPSGTATGEPIPVETIPA